MKTRNYSMDVFRIVAALFVVSCHVDIFVDVSHELFIFFARFFPRFSVAFFFAVSGYFYIKALSEGKKIFKKQFVSLIKVYGLWSLIYYSASFVLNVVLEGEDLWTFLVERVVYFVTCGSYSHFWFFTALIYSVILSTVFYKISNKRGIQILTAISLVLFVFGNLGSSYYEIGLKIPGFSTIITEHMEGFAIFRGNFCMGLPYFMMGYFLMRAEKWIENTEQKKLTMLGIVVFVMYVLEIIVLETVLQWYEYPEVFVMLYPAAFIIIVLLLKNPKPEWQPYAGVCKRLSGYIYYVHPLLILALEMLAGLLGLHIPSIMMYLLVLGIAIGSGYLLILLSKKIKWLNYLT